MSHYGCSPLATPLERWRVHACLYGPWVDELEAGSIRYYCELAGLPMGYGRIGRSPIQLSASEAAAQWGSE